MGDCRSERRLDQEFEARYREHQKNGTAQSGLPSLVPDYPDPQAPYGRWSDTGIPKPKPAERRLLRFRWLP